VSLGPAVPESPQSYAAVPAAIAASQDVFFGGVIAGRPDGVDMHALNACAEVIVRCAGIEPNGFANLRFAALANVSAGAPFFPAAYHDGDRPAFALATEAADLAVSAFRGAPTLEDGRRALIEEIERHGAALTAAGRRLAEEHDCEFRGIDFSLAP
jgi:uncharacterized protein (UPF0210 family)